MLVLALSTLSALVAAQNIDGCTSCGSDPVKCVGLGSFCVGDDTSYDAESPCDRPPGWKSCPICKGPNTVCDENVCKKREAGKGDNCCESFTCDGPRVFCEEWLVCSDRDGAGDRCIPKEETTTSNGEGSFAAAGEDCQSAEGADACGGQYLSCDAQCIFRTPFPGTVTDVTGHCLVDGDCPGGKYCPANSTVSLPCEDSLETIRSATGTGAVLGEECITHMNCGQSFRCEYENPFDRTNAKKTCRKYFSRKANEPCQSWLDCASGLYCNRAPVSNGQGFYSEYQYGYCEEFPPCLGVKPESFDCTRYPNDRLFRGCYPRGYESSRGDRHCLATSDLSTADEMDEYKGRLQSYADCLVSKQCQVFDDSIYAARTWYSTCSRKNCLKLINPMLQRNNRTCATYAAPGTKQGPSAATMLAPKVFSVLSTVSLLLFLRG